jgi:hypothetical protein
MHTSLALHLMNFKEDSRLVAAIRSIGKGKYQSFADYLPEAQQNGMAPIFEYVTDKGVTKGLYWSAEQNRLIVESDYETV